MIKISDGKVGMKEFLAITLVSMFTKATDTTPDILIFAGKNAAWTMPIFSFLILLIPFLVLLSLLKKHNQGLIELLTGIVGKGIGTLVGLLLFILIFTSTTANSRSYIDIVNALFYPKTAIPYLLYLFMFTSFMIAIRGLEAIGRTAWTLFWWFNIAHVILVFLVWKDINWEFLFPIAGPGIQQLAVESYRNVTIYGEIVLLAAFFPFLRSFKEYKQAVFFGWGLSMFWIAFLLAVFTAAFDYPALEDINYSYQQLTRVASFGTFTHLESIFLGVWVIASVLHFAVYLYLVAYIFAKILKLDDFERFILPFAGLAALVGLIPDNVIQLNEVRRINSTIGSIFFISLPFVLWLVDRWKGRRLS